MNTSTETTPVPAETAVKRRYSAAAKASEAALCCPVEYDRRYLEVIPSEVIEKDYGCGDPSRYLKPGETVLDLGSGTGKICFIAAQVVGAKGHVIGVDMTDDMLEVARRNAPIVAQRLGYTNVEFRKGRIQDLALDLELLDRELSNGWQRTSNADSLSPRGTSGERVRERGVQEMSSSPQPSPPSDGGEGDISRSTRINTCESFLAAEELAAELRITYPLVATDSIDVVVSNCVLNLVEPKSKRQLFSEIFRVLKKGGRAVISDIVSDEEVPESMQNDPELWSGCISGALTEEGFLKAFSDAGFYGIQILKRDDKPWRTVEGIEFRSVTVQAFKGKQGPCFERNQAVIYRGPFKEVLDDDGHRLERGRRYAVCDKTFHLYRKEPYKNFFAFIEPLEEIPPDEAKPFACGTIRSRHPKETKGQNCNVTTEAGQCCDGGNGACC